LPAHREQHVDVRPHPGELGTRDGKPFDQLSETGIADVIGVLDAKHRDHLARLLGPVREDPARALVREHEPQHVRLDTRSLAVDAEQSRKGLVSRQDVPTRTRH
jgi:hypothetical protein